MNQVPPDTNPIFWRERIVFERSDKFSRLFKACFDLGGTYVLREFLFVTFSEHSCSNFVHGRLLCSFHE